MRRGNVCKYGNKMKEIKNLQTQKHFTSSNRPKSRTGGLICAGFRVVVVITRAAQISRVYTKQQPIYSLTYLPTYLPHIPTYHGFLSSTADKFAYI